MPKKGFTLVELLAVIAVLGIILLIAIPSVTKTINKSAKNVFITSAQKVIDEAKIYIMNNNTELPIGNSYVSIPITSLNFDNKASYDNTGGVLIINLGTEDEPNYDYYVYLSNDEFVLNGTNKENISDNVQYKGTTAPYIAVTIPTSAAVLIYEAEGITGHVENVTVADDDYIEYTLY